MVCVDMDMAEQPKKQEYVTDRNISVSEIPLADPVWPKSGTQLALRGRLS